MARHLLISGPMRRPFNILILVFGLGASLLARPGFASPEWNEVRTEPDGLRLESRVVPETAIPELRVVTRARARPQALLDSAWALRDKGMQTKYLAERKVLSEATGERVQFLRYEPPIIKPRACVLRQVRSADRATGAVAMNFNKLHYLPGSANGVPFAQLRGQWSFEPDGDTTRIVYTVLVDVGGIPPWLARGAQEDAAVDTVREVIAGAGAVAAR